MYKKIYSKFTKERKEEFQLETEIYKTEDGKKVMKRPLSEKAEKHIQHMYEIYEMYLDKGVQVLSECKMEGNRVTFSFQQGTSLCTELLHMADKKDEVGFYHVLEKYRVLIENLVLQEEAFVSSKEFEEVFGSYATLVDSRAARYQNIDMTFDNIILDETGSPKVIDYEWVFDCLLPIRFVYFRAVNNLFIKYSKELQDFITKERVFGFFQIGQEEENIFKKMDKKFVEYVYGKEESYNKVVEKYAKPYIDVTTQLKEQSPLLVQLYVDYGNGYAEADSQIIAVPLVGDKIKVVFSDFKCKQIKKIRIDPGMEPIILRDIQIVCQNNNRANQMLEITATNSSGQANGVYIFQTDDPWVECGKEVHGITAIQVEMTVLLKDKVEAMMAIYDTIYADKLVQLESLFEEKDKLLQDNEQMKSQYEYQINKLENMNQIYLEIKHVLEKQVNELSNECRCLRKVNNQ